MPGSVVAHLPCLRFRAEPCSAPCGSGFSLARCPRPGGEALLQRGVQGAGQLGARRSAAVQANLGPGRSGLRQGPNGLAAEARRSRAGAHGDPGSMASAVGLGALHTSDPSAHSERSGQ